MAKGVKTGGRTKGTPNKRTLANQALLESAAGPDLSPLEVMLKAMRKAWDEGDIAAAANFAKDAAPYLHPKLSSIEHKGDPDNPLETVNRIELVAPTHCDSPDRTAAQAVVGVFGAS